MSYWVKTQLADQYGFAVECTPMDELRVVSPYRLAGATFIGTTLDSTYWTSSLGTGGAATMGNCQVILSTGTTANNTTSLTSNRVGRYITGSSDQFKGIIRLPDTGTANNTRKWGAFNATDGAYFKLSGTTLYAVTYKTSSETAVAAASWNGATFAMDTSVHSYEIYYTLSKVYFVIDGILRHTVAAASTTWSDTVNLPVRFENNNSGGSTTDVAMNIRSGSIYRLGNLISQVTSKFQSGTTAGLICKYGAGNLSEAIISNVSANAAITLYDNTAASGTIIWQSGAMGALTQPFPIDFKNLPFSIGLTLVIATAACNVLLIFE